MDRPGDDPTLPPPGTRTGTGSESLLPFIRKGLAANPTAPQPSDYADSKPHKEEKPGDSR